jgi:hypothetical protein
MDENPRDLFTRSGAARKANVAPQVCVTQTCEEPCYGFRMNDANAKKPVETKKEALEQNPTEKSRVRLRTGLKAGQFYSNFAF